MQADSRPNSPGPWRIGEWHAVPDRLCRSTLLRTLSVLIAVVTTANVCLAEADGNWPSPLSLGIFLVQSIGILWGSFAVANSRHGQQNPSGGSLAIILVALLSLGWYGGLAIAMPEHRTLELLALSGMRNLVLATALFSVWMRYQRLTLLLGFFVTLFAATVSQYAPLVPGMVAFATLGAAWLYGVHWHDLRGQRLDTTRLASWHVRILVPVGWLLLVASMLVFSQASSAGALRGFLPSSGGDRWFHAAALGGVFDGDHLVAGAQNIQSFAPIEDAPFIPDHQPSLYDAFNDAYEEPVLSKKTERSIPLPLEMGTEIERRMAVSEQAARQFTTSRLPKQGDRRRVKDLETAALLHVAGDTPLHLRLETYDLFDGVHWYAEDDLERVSRLELTPREIDDRPWLIFPHRFRGLPFFGGTRTHAIKLVHLVTDRVPAPLHLHAIHVDMLDRSPIFHGKQNGFVHVDRESIPPLMPIHLVWDELDPRLVERHLKSIPSLHNEFTVVPELPGMQRIRALAETWTADLPRGWGQIMEVIEQLRFRGRHDRDARAPEEHEFPVEHFLFEGLRGPDYQFATAAALMLRSLDYPTRVVSGFYVSPERYDARRRHTPVLSEDVHFWVEVHLGVGIWAPLEPTPGYALLSPRGTWVERTFALLGSAWTAIVQRWWATLMVITAVGLGIYYRCAILDRLQVALWTLWPHRSHRRKVLAVLNILDRRGRWARLPRNKASTPGEWLRTVVLVDTSSNLTPFLTAVDWAAFAPAGSPGPERDLDAICRGALELCTLPELEAARRTTHASPRSPEHLFRRVARRVWPISETGSTSPPEVAEPPYPPQQPNFSPHYPDVAQ